MSTNRFRHPLKFTHRRARVTQAFGVSRNPITGINRLHAAVDWAYRGIGGAAVFPTARGVVLSVGSNLDPRTGLGNYVVLDHGRGVTSLYAHLRDRSRVKEGQTVTGYSLLGRVGQTGGATGDHLHFGISINGVAVDPLAYIAKR